MKALTISILTILLIGVIFSCILIGLNKINDTDAPTETYPQRPECEPHGYIRYNFARKYTIAEGYDEAELVAVITVDKWLGEDTEWRRTFFRAKVENILKNDIGFDGDELTFLQSGYSELIVPGYRLYDEGDKLLLCLIRMDTESLITKYGEVFYISGWPMTELYLAEDDGEEYFTRSNMYYNLDDVAMFTEKYRSYYDKDIEKIKIIKSQLLAGEIQLSEINDIFFERYIQVRDMLKITLDELLDYFEFCEKLMH